MTQRSICILSHTLPQRSTGGAERQMALLGKLLEERGWTVVFGAPETDADQATVRLSSNPHSLRSLRSDARALAETAHDVYYLRGLMTRAAALRWASRAIRKANPNAKFVLAAANEQETHWGFYRRWVREAETPPLLRPIANLRAVLREAAARWGRGVFDRFWTSRIEQTNNGGRMGARPSISIPFLAEFPDAAPPLPDGPLRALWIGSFRWIKEPEKVLELAQRARRDPTLKSIRFFMAGPIVEERYRKPLEEAVRTGEIEYLGELDRAGIEKAIADSHLLIKTNPVEAMPNNAMVECWGSGRPTLALASPGGFDLEAQRLGWTEPALEGMLERLRRLHSNPEELAETGANARDYAVINHSLTAIAPRIVQALEGEGGSPN